jgi:predicted nucleic acid-binding protein
LKLLDSTVAIDYLRDDERAVAVVESLFAAGVPVAASEMTRFEVLSGMKPLEQVATEELFAEVVWVAIGERVSRAGALLARRYRKSHSGIEDGDYLIAATALELDADLLTTNVRHFPMFAGLTAAY